MQIERRALYNSLRMNWQLDPSNMDVEPWQVEDYRILPLEILLARLKQLGVHLDRTTFLAFAENCDTPEDLTDYLVGDEIVDDLTQDQIYLLVFEMWRRMFSEKPCLSIFCDELDQLISLYDQEKLDKAETLQDAIANLLDILDENVDSGVKPKSAFEYVSSCCANDLEEFLYDFISEQIDSGNYLYASELIDDYEKYVLKNKWFEFLKARVMTASDPEMTLKLVKKLIKDCQKEPDLEFNFELLSFLVQEGDQETFSKLVKTTIPVLGVEEDIQDLLTIVADFFHCLDNEKQEQEILNLARERSHIPQDVTVDHDDPFFKKLLLLIK